MLNCWIVVPGWIDRRQDDVDRHLTVATEQPDMLLNLEKNKHTNELSIIYDETRFSSENLNRPLKKKTHQKVERAFLKCLQTLSCVCSELILSICIQCERDWTWIVAIIWNNRSSYSANLYLYKFVWFQPRNQITRWVRGK